MSETSPEMTDVLRVQALIEGMDALLAQGRQAMEKLDRFYQEHDLPPDIGKKVLTSDPRVPERHQIIFTKLLKEWETLEQQIDERLTQASPTTRPSARSRAVGNRFRI